MPSDFDTLTDFQNLYSSMKATMKGCRSRASAQRFYRNALENICVMKRELIERTYVVSPYSEFIVTEPKRRVIKSGAFRDKVLQHCLCDYVLIPKLQSVFIRDNYAGQVGKGTLFGLNRLTEHLMNHFAEHGAVGYILKCDITKFYYSIKHDVLKGLICQYFEDEGIRWICNLLIDSTEGDGLPLGNQCSQVFALLYLVSLDDLITKSLGHDKYGRYSDDFFVISTDKDRLKQTLLSISSHLAQKGLSLNRKTEIVPIRKGIRFLGFHVYLTQDGKVIRKVYGEKKRAEKKKLRRCAKRVRDGKMTRQKFDEIYNSIMNHLSNGNCYHLRMEMDNMVRKILDDPKDGETVCNRD